MATLGQRCLRLSLHCWPAAHCKVDAALLLNLVALLEHRTLDLAIKIPPHHSLDFEFSLVAAAKNPQLCHGVRALAEFRGKRLQKGTAPRLEHGIGGHSDATVRTSDLFAWDCASKNAQCRAALG